MTEIKPIPARTILIVAILIVAMLTFIAYAIDAGAYNKGVDDAKLVCSERMLNPYDFENGGKQNADD